MVDAINSDIQADGDLADQLIFVQVNMDSLLIIKAAIAKYHSTAPAAIEAALESFHDNLFFWKQWVYRFTPSNHFGFTGERVCNCHLSDSTGFQSSITGKCRRLTSATVRLFASRA